LLGTCFLQRLRRRMFQCVKFSSVTGKALRVLSAPTLRFVHIQLDTVSLCNITAPTAFSGSADPKDPEFKDSRRNFTDTVSKSRQFLSSDSQNVVLFSSAQFIGMWCSRCNGTVSPDIISLIDSLFGPQTSDGGPSLPFPSPLPSPSPPVESPPPDSSPSNSPLSQSQNMPLTKNLRHAGVSQVRHTTSNHRFEENSKIRMETSAQTTLDDDHPNSGFGPDVYVPTSDMSYTLEQVCVGEFDLNTTHFAKNCSFFMPHKRCSEDISMIQIPTGFQCSRMLYRSDQP